METLGICDLYNPLGVHGDELVAVLDDFEGQNRREMSLDFVNKGLDVRVPDTNLVIKPSTKQ